MQPPPHAAEIPPPPPIDDGDVSDEYTDEEVIEEFIEEIIEEEIEEADENSEFCDGNNDSSQDIKSEGRDEKMISHTLMAEAHKPLTYSGEGSIGNINFSGTSDEQLTPEKEKFYGNCSNYSDNHLNNAAPQVTPDSATDSKVNVNLISTQTHQDFKPNCGTSSGSSNNEIQEMGRQSNVSGKDVAIAVTLSGEQPDALKYVEEIKQMGNRDGKKRTVLRLGDSAPEGWTRSLPSDDGIDNGNKRQAIICDFHARGWCIKGSACRFLHIKDTAKTTAQTSTYTSKPSERLPSHITSSWMGSSYDSGSSSLKGIPSYCQSFSSGMMDLRTPNFLFLHAKPSSFFGSEAAKSPLANAISEQSCSAQHRTKFTPSNWEPSIPFQASFYVSSILGATSGSLLNSSELLNLGDGTYRSRYTQGTSMLNATDRIHSNSGTGIAGPKCNDDKHSASSHDRNKIISLPIGADIEGDSVVDGQSGTGPKEDKPLDFAESHNVTHQSDGLRNRGELVTHREKQKYKMADKQVEDVDVQKESEVLQHFRAALIDFVKELVKPTWREGRLSRDAHKIVVKKASDKVISTLQFNQIPAGTELIKLFLSSSQTKIMKLVEGYVEKYGKL